MTVPNMTNDPGGERMGNWIATYTGIAIYPLDPDPALIDPHDIAHSLANQCRFTGHTREFYSTAQHAYLVSTIVSKEYALEGLLHDGSEAYISDIASPIKRSKEFGDYYKEFEDRLTEAICERFNLTYPLPDEIKVADKMMLRAEQRDLMPNDPSEGEQYKGKIVPWKPYEAEQMFLKRYSELTGEKVTMPSRPTTSLWELKRTQRKKD